MSIFSVIPPELLLVGSSAILGVFKSFKFIREGERGIKLRFGRAVRKNGEPKIYEPGFTLLVPFVDTLLRHHVRQQTILITDQRIMTNNGLTYLVSGALIYRVKNVYRALVEIDALEDSLSDIVAGALRNDISTRTHSSMKTSEIMRNVLAMLRTRAEEWGVELIDFMITNCAPTSETVNLLNIPVKLEMLQDVARKLGVEMNEIPSGLASVFVGAPLVASTQIVPEWNTAVRAKKEKGLGNLLSFSIKNKEQE